MLFDQQNIFSDNQTITNSAVSDNTIDTGTSKDIGAGADIPVLIQVTETFNNLTSLAVSIQAASSSSFNDGIDVATITIPKASLVQGYKASVITLPMHMKQYIRIHYVVTGTSPTTGKITAGIVDGVQTNG
ncbi:hypothetical protein EI460_17480 [Salmonella enterica subsp. enterica]|nr:hypothetical protein [Salmonella enterica]EBS2230086.1 hypothetical protein [Salmonella enterica subsp. enterica serovar Middlesbrough]EBY6260717.1 hypothetical protein [Salmonella enterica subsp. enterica serovar Warnow]EBZ0012579.1 hypothetical protein [Salmonella enterica subsp. enterica serovar Suberu]ECB3807384.1 hypothetical protein [Salmonella enterica subsp. enterica serovar Fufu]ECG1895482.1 hypothetical protein [Salmonella enterica subsp. enterica]EDU3844893.1 hypothetical protei